MEKFTLSFEYNGRPYTATIEVQEIPEGQAFAITVLDDELATLLSGNAIIREIAGELQADVLAQQVEQTRLKLAIACRLSEHLKVPCFAGSGCLVPDAHVENWEELHPLHRHEVLPDGSIY